MVYLNDRSAQQSKKNDKRQFDRRHSIFYLRIYDTNTGELLGNLVDLSEGGLMLVGDKPLQKGQTFNLSMQLPSASDQHNRLEFKAIAKWSKKEVNPHLFDTGLELIDPTDSMMSTIKELIDAYMFNSTSLIDE